jgi:hypothetical protein
MKLKVLSLLLSMTVAVMAGVITVPSASYLSPIISVANAATLKKAPKHKIVKKAKPRKPVSLKKRKAVSLKRKNDKATRIKARSLINNGGSKPRVDAKSIERVSRALKSLKNQVKLEEGLNTHKSGSPEVLKSTSKAKKRKASYKTNSNGVSSTTSKKREKLPTSIVLSKTPKVLLHKATSGAQLKPDPNKTTTILGSYHKDMKFIIRELGHPKNLDFQAKKGHFNVLNTPNSLYGKYGEKFFNKYNKPFIDEAIKRGDHFLLATKPTRENMFNTSISGKSRLTGYGREIQYLRSKGYFFDNKSMEMKK